MAWGRAARQLRIYLPCGTDAQRSCAPLVYTMYIVSCMIFVIILIPINRCFQLCGVYTDVFFNFQHCTCQPWS